VTRPEVLVTAWGPESAPAVGGRNRARARGIGVFSPDAQARPQREVEADRWAAMDRGAHQAMVHRERERERKQVEQVCDAVHVGSDPLRRK
jgi:hypothetical protein